MVDFEKEFSDFLDDAEYDQAENALFNITRAAFNAGWVAAGGDQPYPKDEFELFRSNKIIPLKVIKGGSE